MKTIGKGSNARFHGVGEKRERARVNALMKIIVAS
jgi:hypothetical protein